MRRPKQMTLPGTIEACLADVVIHMEILAKATVKQQQNVADDRAYQDLQAARYTLHERLFDLFSAAGLLE